MVSVIECFFKLHSPETLLRLKKGDILKIDDKFKFRCNEVYAQTTTS